MKKKMMILSLFLLILLPIILLLAGCTEWVESESCCLSPMTAVPFLLLAVFQMRNN